MCGLSHSLKNAEMNGTIHGCKISRTTPAISHLLFADDIFLFFRATTDEAQSIKNILNIYEKYSGQTVNFQKSGIFYSSNVHKDKQTEISRILVVWNDLTKSRYLGLPSLVGKSKKAVFSYVKEKVNKKLQQWNNKLLSRAGKAVLIKSVAQRQFLAIRCLVFCFQELFVRRLNVY